MRRDETVLRAHRSLLAIYLTDVDWARDGTTDSYKGIRNLFFISNTYYSSNIIEEEEEEGEGEGFSMCSRLN